MTRLPKSIPLLYGGSCKPANADALFACPDVDGGLIGGAALDPDSFGALVEAAGRVVQPRFNQRRKHLEWLGFGFTSGVSLHAPGHEIATAWLADAGCSMFEEAADGLHAFAKKEELDAKLGLSDPDGLDPHWGSSHGLCPKWRRRIGMPNGKRITRKSPSEMHPGRAPFHPT